MYVNDMKQTFIKKVVNIKNNKTETVDRTKRSARIYYLNYLKHVNDNVGRPVLAVNSDSIIQ